MKTFFVYNLHFSVFIVICFQLPLNIFGTGTVFNNGRFNPYSVGEPEGLILNGETITEAWADMKVDNFNESSDTWQNVI